MSFGYLACPHQHTFQVRKSELWFGPNGFEVQSERDRDKGKLIERERNKQRKQKTGMQSIQVQTRYLQPDICSTPGLTIYPGASCNHFQRYSWGTAAAAAAAAAAAGSTPCCSSREFLVKGGYTPLAQ
jgi:hypothetical protein